MALIEEESGPAFRLHQIGQELSLLSVGELEDRIAVLRTEIERLEKEMEAKSATKARADALFRRS